MMKILRHTLTVLVFAVALALAWAWIARTPWAGGVAVGIDGGSGTPFDPMRYVLGALLVAVPAVLLVRAGWDRFGAPALGRVPRRHPERSRIPPELARARRGSDGGEFPESVPPELESIVMKAMAMEKENRHATAMELYDVVQRFLEGEKQREYNHQMAQAKVAAG